MYFKCLFRIFQLFLLDCIGSRFALQKINIITIAIYYFLNYIWYLINALQLDNKEIYRNENMENSIILSDLRLNNTNVTANTNMIKFGKYTLI